MSSEAAAVGATGSVGVWHYYAAVGNREAKLATLVELLHALQSTCRRPLAICCGSRDSLDSLVYSLLRSRAFAVTAIHSDLTDKEKEMALSGFKRAFAGGAAAGPGSVPESPGTAAAAAALAPTASGGSGRDVAAGGGLGGGSAPGPLAAAASAPPAQDPGESLVGVLALTDVCLKALPKELLPLGVNLLVEFDLPPSKEVYTRRVSALFGGLRERRTRSQRCVVVDMVEAGALGAFRALEGFAASAVKEMPVRVEDMFAAA